MPSSLNQCIPCTPGPTQPEHQCRFSVRRDVPARYTVFHGLKESAALPDEFHQLRIITIHQFRSPNTLPGTSVSPSYCISKNTVFRNINRISIRHLQLRGDL